MITKKPVSFHIWAFQSQEALDSKDLKHAHPLGTASSAQDLIDLSKGDYLSFTPQLVNYVWYSYDEAMQKLGDKPFTHFVRKLGLFRFFAGLYYKYIWMKAVRHMTDKEFKDREHVGSRFFVQSADSFFLIRGTGPWFEIANVHFNTIKPRGRTAGVWVNKVLYRGPKGQLVQDTTPTVLLEDCYLNR